MTLYQEIQKTKSLPSLSLGFAFANTGGLAFANTEGLAYVPTDFLYVSIFKKNEFFCPQIVYEQQKSPILRRQLQK